MKSDQGRSKAEAETATPAEPDISGPTPTKREDTVDEILVDIGNQGSDTGNYTINLSNTYTVMMS